MPRRGSTSNSNKEEEEIRSRIVKAPIGFTVTGFYDTEPITPKTPRLAAEPS